jgi:multidrug transporter EmrE-like cation transporter
VSAWTVVFVAVVAKVVALTALTAPPARRPRRVQALAFAEWAASLAQLPLAVRELSLGVVYAVPSAGGATRLAVTATLVFSGRLDWLTVSGLALTLTGTAVVLVGHPTPS